MDTRHQLNNATSKQHMLNLNAQYANIDILRNAINSGTLSEKFKAPLIDTIHFENNTLGFMKKDTLRLFMSFFKDTNIRTLYLSNNSLEQLDKEAMITFVCSLKETSINALYLDHNQIYQWGLNKFNCFAQALQTNMGDKLKLLSLESNHLWYLGKTYLLSLGALIQNSRLETLQLDGNHLEYFLPATYKDTPCGHLSESFTAYLEEKYFGVNSITSISDNDAILYPNLFQRFQHVIDDVKIIEEKQKCEQEVENFQGGILSKSFRKYAKEQHHSHMNVALYLKKINELLAANALRYGNSLKELAMFTIYSHPEKINWRAANIPKDLKETLEERNPSRIRNH